MEVNRIEVMHNTEQQVHDYVEAAQRIADALGIDREREHEVFVQIVTLVASKTVQVVHQPVGVAGVALPGPMMS